jgi:Protein of unknown function (DUF1177)
MVLSHCLAAYQLLSRADVTGSQVADLLDARGLTDVQVEHVETDRGATDFVKARVRGAPGPTLGVIGRLGGVGARPSRSGLVSDADGAIVTVATALALADLQAAGDDLCGQVILTTHICPRAPIIPHEPVPFMGSPVDQATKNRYDVDPAMQAILSVDTTRGNRLVNQRGFAITPTVMQGWILRVSEALLDLQTWVSGRLPLVLPLTTQDVTPYGNGLYHMNSILQPSTATAAPVVGVALTAQSIVPGCATGASQIVDIEEAVRFCVEVAKAFGGGACPFYDQAEWEIILQRYGPLDRLQQL